MGVASARPDNILGAEPRARQRGAVAHKIIPLFRRILTAENAMLDLSSKAILPFRIGVVGWPIIDVN